VSYTTLTADVVSWLNRTDITSGQLGSFVSLFEAKAGRMLRVRQQETAFSGTIDADNQIALPADFSAFKTLWIDGYEGNPPESQSLDTVIARKRTSGIPTMYAIGGSTVRFDGSGDVVGVYFGSIPRLETAGTNWLETIAYDAYLFGALSEAWGFLMDDAQSAKYAARCANVLSDVMAADQRDRFNGPLVARKR